MKHGCLYHYRRTEIEPATLSRYRGGAYGHTAVGGRHAACVRRPKYLQSYVRLPLQENVISLGRKAQDALKNYREDPTRQVRLRQHLFNYVKTPRRVPLQSNNIHKILPNCSKHISATQQHVPSVHTVEALVTTRCCFKCALAFA